MNPLTQILSDYRQLAAYVARGTQPTTGAPMAKGTCAGPTPPVASAPPSGT